VRYSIAIALSGCLLCLPAKSFAGETFARIGPELGYMNGDSTCRISFDEPWESGGHGESELEFPLDNLLVGMSLVAGTRHVKTDQVIGRFGMTLLVIPTADAGIMKDSDWIENDAAYGEAPHAGRDQYTESDAQVKGMMFDVNYAYHFRCNNSLTVGPLIGFRYQQLEYDVIDYRGIYWTTPVSREGKAMEYEVKYRIPYIGLSSGLVFGANNQFQIHLSLSYSGWAMADDRDDHLLKYKWAEADCKGDAYLISFDCSWEFRPHWLLGIGAEYVDIDTTGTQYQTYYGGPFAGQTFHDIHDTITSYAWSALFRICYRASGKP
jgi:outer membrane protease